jgi:type IV fimbrial biogenesis protein FimT
MDYLNKRRIDRAGHAPGPAAHRGVTAVDLMITVAVAAILLVGGVPTFSATVHKNRIESAASQLYASLSLARGEAVKRRRGVRICPSADAAACRADGDWSDGWLVFADANGNNTPEAAEVIRVVDGLEAGIAIEVSSAFAGYLQFQPTGAAAGNAGSSGDFRVCHADSQVAAQALWVSPAGRVEQHRGESPSCGEEG